MVYNMKSDTLLHNLKTRHFFFHFSFSEAFSSSYNGRHEIPAHKGEPIYLDIGSALHSS